MNRKIRPWVLGLILLLTGAASTYLMVEAKQATNTSGTYPDLKAMVPTAFGEWVMVPNILVVPIEEKLKSKEDAAYGATLSRVYTNDKGDLVMLSVAYGSNQLNDRVQAHRPEFCYGVQGFTVLSSRDEQIATQAGPLPIRRLMTSRPGRDEPISYWMTMDQTAIRPGIERKLAQLRYGLQGLAPDGLLVRVSTLSAHPENDYPIHDRFIRDMANAVNDKPRFGLGSATAIK